MLKFRKTKEQVEASRAARLHAERQSDLIRIWDPSAGWGYLVNRLRFCRDETKGSMGWFRAMRAHARAVGGTIAIPNTEDAQCFLEEADFDPTAFYVGHAGNAAIVGFVEFLDEFGIGDESESAERERDARLLADHLALVSDPYGFSAVSVIVKPDGSVVQARPLSWGMRAVPNIEDVDT